MKSMNSFFASKNGDKILKSVIFLGIALLYINRNYLNYVVSSQVTYFLIILAFGYVLRNILEAILSKRRSFEKLDLLVSLVDVTSIYEDIISSTNKILLLRLKEGFSIALSLFYFFITLAIGYLNGGIEKSSTNLLFTSIPFVTFFLFYLDSSMNRFYKFYRFFLLIGFLLLSYFVFLKEPIFVLDLLLLFIGIWVAFLGLIYPRNKVYSLSILFLISIPVFSLLNMVDSANFSANCAYMLLLLGVFKDLFYDLVFKS